MKSNFYDPEVVRLMRRPCPTPQKLPPPPISGTHFCQRLSKTQGLVQMEGLGKLKKFSDLIGSQTCNLACSILPQPSRVPRAAVSLLLSANYFVTLKEGTLVWENIKLLPSTVPIHKLLYEMSVNTRSKDVNTQNMIM
jgi:hypothetical protein